MVDRLQASQRRTALALGWTAGIEGALLSAMFWCLRPDSFVEFAMVSFVLAGLAVGAIVRHHFREAELIFGSTPQVQPAPASPASTPADAFGAETAALKDTLKSLRDDVSGRLDNVVTSSG